MVLNNSIMTQKDHVIIYEIHIDTFMEKLISLFTSLRMIRQLFLLLLKGIIKRSPRKHQNFGFECLILDELK